MIIDKNIKIGYKLYEQILQDTQPKFGASNKTIEGRQSETVRYHKLSKVEEKKHKGVLAPRCPGYCSDRVDKISSKI